MTQNLTRAAFLTATCVVLGYLFMPIPNVEMITVGIFISGIWMGPVIGIFIGLLAEAIYSLTNPMGFPPPPLLVAQLIGMATVGGIGGLTRNLLQKTAFFSKSGWLIHPFLAGLGLLLTFWYDLLTNLSFPLAAGFNTEQIKVALAMGIPFAALHIVINSAIFALVVPVFLHRFKAWRTP